MPKIKNISDKDIRLMIPVIAFLIIFMALGGLFYFKKNGKTTEINKENININYITAKGEVAKTKEEISGQSRLVYAEKTVVQVSDSGENKYQTDFYLTDEKGEKKFKFYSADDLTYETSYPYLADTIIIVKEFGQAENRVVGVDGQKKEIFLPPVAFGTDFVLSADKNQIAYLENKTAGTPVADISGFNYWLKIKNLADGKILEFDPSTIKHGGNSFDLYLPAGVAADNSQVYFFAQNQVSDDYARNPGGLYALNLESLSVSEIYYSSAEENEDKDMIVLLCLYPQEGFALVNRGPQLVREGETVLRTQLQRLDLKTGLFTDIFVNEKADQAGSGGKLISPDGQKLILLNDAYYDKGLALYNIKSKKTVKLTNQGEFKAWWPDSNTIFYQTYFASEGLNKEKIELHSLNVENLQDFIIYTQDTLSQGTGLNRPGEIFYEFIGII